MNIIKNIINNLNYNHEKLKRILFLRYSSLNLKRNKRKFYIKRIIQIFKLSF